MASGWTDEFDGAQLHERWRWCAPAGGHCELRAGWLALSVPPREKGFNHWNGVFDAPMLLMEAPGGDWAAEAKLNLADFAPDSDFHVGMALAMSDHYLWLWGPYYAATSWKTQQPQLWLERTGEAGLLKVPLADKAINLRAEKRGSWLRFLWRADERGQWQEAGKSLAWFAPKQLGLIVKTWANGRPLELCVDHFRFESLPSEPSLLTAAVRLNPRRRLNEINPRIYGQFIEQLGRCIYGGLWAEMLHNRKFTGEPQPSGVVGEWQPFGRNAQCHADNATFLVGGQSQCIVGTGAGEHGVAQNGLAVLAKDYAGRVIVRGDGVGEATVSLRASGKVLATQTLLGVTSRWKKLRFRLAIKEAASDAALVVTFGGKGTLWVGAASLMPADNVDGMRRNVVEAICDIKPPVVRWPGGNFASGYHWRDGIGDPDKRPPRWDRAWGAWEWNDFGTEEFVKFCRHVGSEPYLCVNAGEAYEDEAADWVEYCKRKGHRVRYWGLGNEMYGDWQLGHLDAAKYGLKAILFAQAMRKVQPDARLIAVGVDGAGWGAWNEKVVRTAGAHFNLLAPHYYQGYNPNDDPRQVYSLVASSPVAIERMLRETFAIVQRNAPKGKRLPLAFDEWNVWEPHQTGEAGFESFYALRDGLFAAGVFHALHRCGDFVEMANLAQTVNVLGALRTSQTQLVKTPIYWAFWIYVRNTGKWRVGSEVDTPLGTAPVAGETAVVDASATLSADSKSLFVGLLNRHPESDVTVQLDLGDFKAASQVRLCRLSGKHFTDTNTFAQPDRVVPTEQTLTLGEALRMTLPRHSVTMLRLERRE